MSEIGVAEGQGVTISFAVLTIVLNLLDVTQDGVSVEDVNCSDQSTTGYESYIGSTLKEGGTYTCNVNWNLEDQVALYAGIGITDTITFTYPLHDPTNTQNASDAIVGYINEVTKTSAKGTLINGTVRIKVAGTPTYVNEDTP